MNWPGHRTVTGHRVVVKRGPWYFRKTKDRGKLREIHCQRLIVGVVQVINIPSRPNFNTNNLYQVLTASRVLLNVTQYKLFCSIRKMMGRKWSHSLSYQNLCKILFVARELFKFHLICLS